jgi:hypothetical protein
VLLAAIYAAERTIHEAANRLVAVRGASIDPSGDYVFVGSDVRRGMTISVRHFCGSGSWVGSLK